MSDVVDAPDKEEGKESAMSSSAMDDTSEVPGDKKVVDAFASVFGTGGIEKGKRDSSKVRRGKKRNK